MCGCTQSRQTGRVWEFNKLGLAGSESCYCRRKKFKHSRQIWKTSQKICEQLSSFHDTPDDHESKAGNMSWFSGDGSDTRGGWVIKAFGVKI